MCICFQTNTLFLFAQVLTLAGNPLVLPKGKKEEKKTQLLIWQE